MRVGSHATRHGFSGGGGPPPRNDLHPPPEAFCTSPKSFCTPANYIYFDLIVSYLIILTTKFVKLPILWSQISPCRPKTNFVKLFPWPFRALPPRPGQSQQQHPPRYLSTPPPNENMKIRLTRPWSAVLNAFPTLSCILFKLNETLTCILFKV